MKPDLITTDCCVVICLTRREPESPVSESESYDGRLSDSSVAAVHGNPPASGGAFVPQGLAVKKFKKS